MKKQFYCVCFLLFLLNSLRVNAQNAREAAPNVSDFAKLEDILPPSPDASSLGKYGGVAPSISTGAMSLNIPIYNYQSIFLTLPISLSYHTNGFKVDEISTRVGTSWNLQAGGVVTHTVAGSDDNSSQRLTPPADFNVRNSELLNYLEAVNISTEAAFDSQPDTYSYNFNGNSGQFILDNSFNPLLLTHSNLKIEKDFQGTAWNIRITAADGIQYFFGGESATEFTRHYSSGVSCGKSYEAYIPTAYFLTKIIHPNHDTINLSYSVRSITYKTGISETFFNYDQTTKISTCSASSSQTAPNLNNSACASWLSTKACLIKEITSTGGVKVRFKYINRTDGNDRLVSRIEILDPDGNVIKSHKLDYETATSKSIYHNSYTADDASLKYRPFLKSITEQSSDSVFTKVHSFYYNDINNLPPRLSYSQDDYGFFNGKQNASLSPLPSSLSWQRELPQATANRSPDYTFARKGLLERVVYPTGGYDSIEYGGNYVYKQVPVYPAPIEVSVLATSTEIAGGGVKSESSTLPVLITQEVRFQGSCAFVGASEEDPIHNKAKIELVKIVSGTETPIWSNFIEPGDVVDLILNLVQGDNYKIIATAYGTNVSARAKLNYMQGAVSYQYTNKEVGGTTVKRVFTGDYLTGKTEVRRLFYTQFPNVENSSANLIRTPIYEKLHLVYTSCSAPQNEGGTTSILECGNYNTWYYRSTHSSTQNNIYMSGSSPVIYRTVVESFGENFENGGIEHQFEQSPDVPAQIIQGNSFLGAPYTSYTWKNGREVYTRYFSKQGNSFLTVKKQFVHYKEDIRVYNDFKAYVVNKRYESQCQSDPPASYEIDAYDCMAYSLLQRWAYPDSTTTIHYNSNQQEALREVSYTEYGNKAHALPTRVTVSSSDEKLNIVENLYPQDVTLTGASEIARQSLVSKNMLAALLEQRVLKNNTELMKMRTEYSVFPNGLTLPAKLYTQTGTNAEEVRIGFSKYDDFGKILERSRVNDVKQGYIWGYKNVYPIAQVENASATEIAFTSFEEESKGNWLFSGIASDDASAPTGKRVYNVSGGSVQKNSLTSSSSYILSYYYKAGSAITVTGGTQSNITTRHYRGDWYFYQSRVTGTTAVTITGTGTIDELRLHPVGSHMISYTYNPAIGPTTVTDTNSLPSYYHYDTMGRLANILDSKGNVVKTFRYNYKK